MKMHKNDDCGQGFGVKQPWVQFLALAHTCDIQWVFLNPLCRNSTEDHFKVKCDNVCEVLTIDRSFKDHDIL
jgi:hypothetical protein